MTATAVAGRGKQSRQGTVFIEAEKECRNDRQTTAVKDTRTECAVFRAENKQSNKNPKGYVSLGTTIHKNLLCLPQDVCILDKINVLGVDSCGFSFYYIVFLRTLFCVLKCRCMAKISLS